MRWIDLPLTEPIDTVIGSTDVLLHRRNALHNPINDVLAEAVRKLAGTQVSTSPGFRFDAIVPPKGAALAEGRQGTGEITLEQLYRILPASPEVAIGKITGRALKAVVEVELTRVFSEEPFEHSGGWFGTIGGVELDVDLARPNGDRVLAMRLAGSGRPIAEDELVSVASCIRPFDDAGTMCGNPGFDEVVPLIDPKTGKPWTPFLALRRAIETGDSIANTSARVVDRGQVERWPRGWAVQPLRDPRPSLTN